MSDEKPEFDEVTERGEITEEQRQFMRWYGLPAAMVAWATFEHLCAIGEVWVSPSMLRKVRATLMREMRERGVATPTEYAAEVVTQATRQAFELTMAEVLERGTFHKEKMQ